MVLPCRTLATRTILQLNIHVSQIIFFSVSFDVAFVISSPFVVVYENTIFMIKLFLSKAKLPPQQPRNLSVKLGVWQLFSTSIVQQSMFPGFYFNGPFTVKHTDENIWRSVYPQQNHISDGSDYSGRVQIERKIFLRRNIANLKY